MYDDRLDRVFGDVKDSKILKNQDFVLDWSLMQDTSFGSLALMGYIYEANENSAFRVYNKDLLSAITFNELIRRKDENLFDWLRNVHLHNNIAVSEEETEACKNEFSSLLYRAKVPVLFEVSPLIDILLGIKDLYYNDFVNTITILFDDYAWKFIDYIDANLGRIFQNAKPNTIKLVHAKEGVQKYIIDMVGEKRCDNKALVIQDDYLLTEAFNNNENFKGATIITPKVGWSEYDREVLTYLRLKDSDNEYIMYQPKLAYRKDNYK